MFAGAAALVAAAALTVGLRACGRPESTTDWRTAIRAAAHDAARDLPGTGLVLLAATTRFLCTCMLLPLAFLVPGPLALALVAIDGRRRPPDGSHRQVGRLPGFRVVACRAGELVGKPGTSGCDPRRGRVAMPIRWWPMPETPPFGRGQRSEVERIAAMSNWRRSRSLTIAPPSASRAL